MNKPLVLSLSTTLAVVALGVGLLACNIEPATASHVPTSSAAEPSPNPLPVEYTDPEITDLPLPVQTYAAMARGLVANGAIPRDKVTLEIIQEDVQREYGIQLTAAQAEAVRSEVLR